MNGTPHEIRLLNPDGMLLANLGPSGHVARAAEGERFPLCALEFELAGRPSASIPVNVFVLGELEGLPPEHEAVRWIVSRPAALAAIRALRRDCYVVDDVVRDDSGSIVGARALARV